MLTLFVFPHGISLPLLAVSFTLLLLKIYRSLISIRLPALPTTASLDTPKPSTPSQIHFPDFISYSGMKLRMNRHYERATSDSERWIAESAGLGERDIASLRGTKGGLLSAMCYPDCDYTGLRLVCDFISYLFYIDDATDSLSGTTQTVKDNIVGAVHETNSQTSKQTFKVTKDYWLRLVADAGAPESAQRQFASSFEAFLKSLHQQAKDRTIGSIPDLESYIALRRDTSGCRPCSALISCANRLDIPDEVINHPVVRALEDATNDLVTWSNDIFSYNVEQSRGDTHNMLVIVMREKGLSLQGAVDFVASMTMQSIDRFYENCTALPSWGPEIDDQVRVYVDGLANWIIGSLHWSFESERYFLKEGRNIKSSRVVTLLPRQV
ncbi:hypothetical protein JAAARDRAFT_129042 [Jaapia argillacea MUCL 33604]|uniref:Terpene synthase n=1 Tax=Jaapia argillacea MUCL 33604 TaxID=933084 RepID=A0A067PXB6_9AGAM|nr:hypothetical protein JAAARDRAFT_129042 [Jaapia argillacea MUCL 33604]